MSDHSPRIQYLCDGTAISTPFIFQSVNIQGAANSVYVHKSTADAVYLSKNPNNPKKYNFKTDYERMQYIIGRQAFPKQCSEY